MTKLCAKCKEEKDVSEFGLDSSQPDRLFSQCKGCRKIYNALPEVKLMKLAHKATPEAKAVIKAYAISPAAKESKKAYSITPGAKAVNKAYQRSPEGRITARKCRLLTTYGLTFEQFDAILASQNGGCAVCETKVPGGNGTWHVDHDHSCCASRKSCGKCVRGLLCQSCNIGQGHFKDDPSRLMASANYLKGPELFMNGSGI